MKHLFLILFFMPIFSLSGCENEKVSPDAVQLSVDFTWQGMKSCGWGNPEIHVNGIPENTKNLTISMYDHAYSHDHGTVKMPYAGETIIRKDRFKKIQGPCPVYTPGRYEITVRALDAGEFIIGMGSKKRLFPEE